MSEIKNYIYFNKYSKIKKHTIVDLFQGSNLVDVVYIFADFETEGKECTIMFQRADGRLIGEVEAYPEASPKINPATNTEMVCYSYVLSGDVLAVAGELQITVRFYDIYIDPVTGIPEDRIKVTGMITATVYESVPAFGVESTVLMNLNHKINTVAEDLITHINNYNQHDHDDRYYIIGDVDSTFANKLDVSGNDIILLNKDNQELSRIHVPTVIQPAMPGNLIFTGTGDFIIESYKKYIIVPLGTTNVSLHVYERSESGETGEITYTKKTTNPILSFTNNQLLETKLDSPTPQSPFDGTYYISGEYWLNGIYDTFEAGYLDFGTISQYNYPVLGFNSGGYYQVYELE